MWKFKLALQQTAAWTRENWPIVLLVAAGLAILQSAC